MASSSSGGLSGGPAARFTAQNQTTDQRLSHTTVGLVELSDFRKRRAEVLEQQEREAREAAAVAKVAKTKAESTETTTTTADNNPPKKKKKKSKSKPTKAVSKLSFLGEEDNDDEDVEPEPAKDDKDQPAKADLTETATPDDADADDFSPPPVALLKTFTKQALRRQAAEREALRKEFLARQAAVKAATVAIPFVFYEGADLPGGVVRVAKGDYVWHFLDRSRKVGARLGVGAAGSGNGSTDADRRPSKAQMHWARINVDDLMLVRGNLIIPHHYDFYYFIINKTLGPGGVRVFDYSDEPAEAPAAADADNKFDESALEGANDDPGLTKVVDRRWYERNKHIFPASVWQEFDPEQDYTQMVRRDQGGNAYFFGGK